MCSSATGSLSRCEAARRSMAGFPTRSCYSVAALPIASRAPIFLHQPEHHEHHLLRKLPLRQCRHRSRGHHRERAGLQLFHLREESLAPVVRPARPPAAEDPGRSGRHLHVQQARHQASLLPDMRDPCLRRRYPSQRQRRRRRESAMRFGITSRRSRSRTSTARPRDANRPRMNQDKLAASQLISSRIAELGDWRGATLARMRRLIQEADPDVVEEWKWRGTPVWSHGGIICTGESYKQVVKLTFAKERRWRIRPVSSMRASTAIPAAQSTSMRNRSRRGRLQGARSPGARPERLRQVEAFQEDEAPGVELGRALATMSPARRARPFVAQSASRRARALATGLFANPLSGSVEEYFAANPRHRAFAGHRPAHGAALPGSARALAVVGAFPGTVSPRS